MADAQTRSDIGPTDFGVPVEFAERARNYARWREAQAPAQPAEAVASTTEAELRSLLGDCAGSKFATIFHPDAPGFAVKLYTHPAPSQPDRAVMQQALDALRSVRSNMLRNDPYLSGKAWGDADAAIAALSATMDQNKHLPHVNSAVGSNL